MSLSKWPYFAIALQTRKLLTSLDRQNFKDFKIVDVEDNVSRVQSLRLFRATPATYYVVSLCDDQMSFEHPKTLLRLMTELRYNRISLLLYVSGTLQHEVCVGFVLSAEAVLQTPDIPKSTTGLVVDLIEHVKALGGRIVTKYVNSKFVGGVAIQAQGRLLGYRDGPIKDRIEARKAISVEPLTPTSLVHCSTNELYGQAQILRDYCGVNERLSIRGRIAHGWQCGSGIIYDDLTATAPNYVWNKRSYDCLKDMCEVHAIGAPYLYMKEVRDPGPIENTLLAIPIHSLVKNKIKDSWDAYAQSILEFAELKKVSSVDVMLYVLDMTEEAIAIFAKYGVGCICAGEQNDDNFLYRTRAIIRTYATVICSRISTALFYSLYECRPTYIWGTVIKTMPKDAYEDVADDLDWVKHYYPTVLAGGLEGVEKAKLELGTDCKKAPESLKALFYDWIL